MSEKKGFFGRLKSGLSKTRDSFVSGMNAVFSGFSEIDDDFYEELEEQLVMADDTNYRGSSGKGKRAEDQRSFFVPGIVKRFHQRTDACRGRCL